MKKTSDRKSYKKRKTPLFFLVIFFIGFIVGIEFSEKSYFITRNKTYQGHQCFDKGKKAFTLLPENIQVCFTPPSGCAEVIVDIIKKSKRTIYVQAYGMTSDSIVKALIKAQKKGVKVKVLLDRSNLRDKWSKMDDLLKRGVEVNIDKVPGIAHNKVMIIDEKIVITGSFNFTKSADKRNAENVIIIDNKNIANLYLKNWFIRRLANKIKT